MKLLVVPLDGTAPFLLKPLFGEAAREFAVSDDYWVIDPEDGTMLVKNPDDESELVWQEMEVLNSKRK